jgi:tetratricopeptide (TPR) repeat protein
MIKLDQIQEPASVPLQHYLQRVRLLIQADNMAEAGRVSAEATDFGFAHPNLLALAAHHHLNHGDGARAIDLATRATELAPGNVNALHTLGSCLAKLGRYRDALKIFDAALGKWPNAYMVHFSRGMALEQVGEVRQARAAYERTLALQPRHAASAARLAFGAAQRGEGARAREYSNYALGVDPRQAFASLALALADLNDGNFEAAQAQAAGVLARPGLQPLTRATALSTIGDALDGQNAPSEAFAAYLEAGEVLRRANEPDSGRETALARVQRLAAFMERMPVELWREAEHPASPVASHVFVVGFPRTGTTLLGQALGGSPDVEVLDESDCLLDSYRFLASDTALEEFAARPSAELDVARAMYWQRVREAGVQLDHSAFIDRMPLNGVVLCLVAKLFPDAKVLFAVRDPRDVVFSCFRRRFGMTSQMYEMLTPQSAAAYYDAVMSLVEIYRRKLPLAFLDVRYENIVSEFENEMRRICAYVGVEYDLAVEACAISENVTALSAVELARGLYPEGIGRWRRYEEQLKAIFPVVAPWTARFGYEAN